jgi:class 3 adenylate cyclase/membrane protein implicated in regulation of membrane protease activity
MQVFGIQRSHQNPNLCNRCGAHLEEGRIVELTAFFADLVGFTSMTNELGPEKSYEVVNGFFQKANEILIRHDAFIDKYIGDAVMAIFNVPIQSKSYVRKALAAAVELQNNLQPLREQFGREIRVRVGVATGFARVGRIGSRDRKDYTAIGDVVNLASRLEAIACPGEIVMDNNTYAQVADEFPDLPAEMAEIKGFKDAVRFRRIQPNTDPGGQAKQLDPLPNINRRQAVSLSSILFAILGAPCAATAILGPLSVFLGVGSLLGAATPVLMSLDQPAVRLPLQIVAVIGSLINLYVIWHGYRKRQEGGDQALPLTTHERQKVMGVGVISLIALAVVGFELYAHIFLMNEPLI